MVLNTISEKGSIDHLVSALTYDRFVIALKVCFGNKHDHMAFDLPPFFFPLPSIGRLCENAV